MAPAVTSLDEAWSLQPCCRNNLALHAAAQDFIAMSNGAECTASALKVVACRKPHLPVVRSHTWRLQRGLEALVSGPQPRPILASTIGANEQTAMNSEVNASNGVRLKQRSHGIAPPRRPRWHQAERGPLTPCGRRPVPVQRTATCTSAA